MDSPARVLYICTTFPRLSETFVEREVRFLAKHLPLQVVSLWKGGKAEGIPVDKISLWRLLSLFLRIPRWLFRNPRGLAAVLKLAFTRPPHSFLNLQEKYLGLGMGILLADRVYRQPPHWIHGIWATAPATAALTIHHLTRAPFSFGAHAYDLFQDGGDCLLQEKIASASWIRTSTEAAAKELERRGSSPDQTTLIRRGLATLPEPTAPRQSNAPVQLLSVGRLVPKKGYSDLLRTCASLRDLGFSFNCTIIGDGPLRKELADLVAELDLTQQIQMTGAIPRHEVEPYFQQADLFIFTGIISPDGDRDGLPNVVPEAMAHGIPVLVRPAAGVLEAVRHNETGIVFSSPKPEDWATPLIDLWKDFEKRKALSRNGRQWVETHFLSETNTRKLAEKILSPKPDA